MNAPQTWTIESNYTPIIFQRRAQFRKQPYRADDGWWVDSTVTAQEQFNELASRTNPFFASLVTGYQPPIDVGASMRLHGFPVDGGNLRASVEIDWTQTSKRTTNRFPGRAIMEASRKK